MTAITVPMFIGMQQVLDFEKDHPIFYLNTSSICICVPLTLSYAVDRCFHNICRSPDIPIPSSRDEDAVISRMVE
jgi:hypothetical protein